MAETIKPPSPDARPITPIRNISETMFPVTPITTSEQNHDSIQEPERLARPRSISRKSSGTLIVSRNEPDVKKHSEYPPDDARGMSPRRSSAECEEMTTQTRDSIRQTASNLQSGLDAITAKIESVKAEYDQLEKNNLALQDYIGGLTRSMSSSTMQSTKAKK